MRSAIVVGVLFAVPFCIHAAVDDRASSSELTTARRLFQEKSYQLALEEIDRLSTPTLAKEQQREAIYLRSRSALQVGRYPEARDGFKELVRDRATDVWAGRAHWQLQPGAPPFGYQMGEPTTTEPLRHLKRADEILSRLKPEDLSSFYEEVAFEALNSLPAYTVPDRTYVFSFFDKLISTLTDEAKIAGAHVRRAQHINFVKPGENAEQEQLRALRQVVKEFPKTEAAAQAQLIVGQHYVSHFDFVAALYELSIVGRNFPGSDAAKQAAQTIAEIKRPEITFHLIGPVFPDQPVTFTLAARNTGDIKLSAIPFDPIGTLKAQHLTRFDLKTINGPSAASQTVRIKKREDFKQTTTVVEFRNPGAGVYVLRAEANGASCHNVLLSSNLVLISNNGGAAQEYWVVDGKTGRPRGGAAIEVASEPKNEHRLFNRDTRAFTRFTNLTSDANGFADFTGSSTRQSDGELFVVAHEGNNYAFLDNSYWNYDSNSQRSGPMVYFYTDRPVYRPKQKVYWRAILRDREDGEYSFDRKHKYDVEILDPKNARLMLHEKVELTEFGSLSGELDLPDAAPLGQYRVYLRQTASNTNIGSGDFRVEEYKKPEYEVTVNAGKEVVRVGGKVQADVSARYYFGAPVADAAVKYTVRRRPRYSTWWDCAFCGTGGKLEDLGWFDARPQERGAMHNSSGDIVATGEGTTDADGAFKVSFQADIPPQAQGEDDSSNIFFPFAKAYRRGSWYPWRPDAFDFQVEVTVTDKSRRNIDGSASVIVGRKALSLSVRTDRYLLTPGDMAKATLGCHSLNDQPTATSGTLYVERLKWNPSAEKDDITTISTQRVDIGASGTLLTQWRVPAGEVGRMRFLLIAPDPFGGDNVAGTEFYVAGPDTHDVYTQYQGLQIIADKTIYESGDHARLMILSEFKDAVAWYWIDGGSGNLEKRVLPLPHRTNFVDIAITDAFAPNTQVHVVAVQNQKVIEDGLELIVPPKKRVLNVSVSGDKPDYRPGEEGDFEIVASDNLGQPVRGEFSISLFDSSILYIAPEMRVDIRRVFYGERRQLRSEIRNSMPAPAGYFETIPPDLGRFLQNEESVQVRGDRWAFSEDSEGRLAGSHRLGFAPKATLRYFSEAPAAVGPMSLGVNAVAATGLAGKDMRLELSDLKEDDSLDLFAKQKKDAPTAEAKVRTDFRDSMFWSPAIVTDEHGRAKVRVKFPDSLTTWKCAAVGTTEDTRVGNATTDTVVRKNLLARLEAPRFFRERDQVTLSAVVHNYLPEAQDVQVSLATGEQLRPGNEGATTESAGARTIRIESNGEARVDWNFDVVKPGETSVTLLALTSAESDAVEMSFPVLQHGIDKFVAWNGTTADESTTEVSVELKDEKTLITRSIELPKERITATTKLTISVNPSLAFAIRDALPYMIEYPYGCTEQTMSRFMPAAVAQHAFRELRLPPDPVSAEKLSPVIEAGLQRLRDFQHADGSWGWWRDDGANSYMSSYVMYGLTIVRQSDVKVDEGMYSRGLQQLHQLVQDQLKNQQNRKNNLIYWWPYDLHTLMFSEFVLALNQQSEPEALDFLCKNRDKLTAHGLALLARALWHTNRQEDARTVLRNMYNVAVITPENDTARWGKLHGGWYWWEEAVEATAMGLIAHLEIDPQNKLVEQSMKWLVLNRQGRKWKSTKDTAQSVLALSTYMLQRKEVVSTMDVRVWLVDDSTSGALTAPELKRFTVSPQNFWSFDGSVVLRGSEIPESASGKLRLQIEKTGTATAFYSVFAEYFTLEEHIRKAGNEIYVERTYEKLVRDPQSSATREAVAAPKDEEDVVVTPAPDGTVVAKDRYVPVHDGESLKSGDELRVTLRIKSLNDYEYLVFEDPKPAGMEPVQLQSGSTYGGGLCANMELRDQHVAFFITHLAQGEHNISYNVRAEIPGTFHTMPTTGYAMYFPPLRSNSDELILKVVDK
ncbi:MAG: MG2 domain-containing protein [Candidatus Sumerlaeaceae bacterium]